MDNCARENKNKDVIAYCSFLVNCKLFTSIELSFLPVGHTHEDIDQLFSCFSNYLKGHNSYTVKDLINSIYKSCKKVKFVIHIKTVAQIKQMIQKEGWIEPISGNINNN